MSFPEIFTIGQNYRLQKLHEAELDFEEPLMNALVMWEPPQRRTSYTIGVDPSWGVGQDRAAIHVLRNGTMNTIDRQVAEFCSDELNVHDLTPICYTLGNLYRNDEEETEALMSVECNISDDIVHQLRNNYNYSNLFIWKFYDNVKRVMSNKLGWWTNARTRPKIINKAVHYIKHGWWDIASPWMIQEMQTIEKLEDKARVAAAQGHHDDLFMAGAIALWSAHDLEFSEFGDIEEVAMRRDRRRTSVIKAADIKLPPIEKRRDFINTACSYDEMLNYDFEPSNETFNQ